MSQPAARLTDPTTSPAYGAGVIIMPCMPTVLIGTLPAARATDMTQGYGPTDPIRMGSPTVLIGGLPAARMGDPTVAEGKILFGFPTVLIGGSSSAGGGAPGLSMTNATDQAAALERAAAEGLPFCEACNLQGGR